MDLAFFFNIDTRVGVTQYCTYFFGLDCVTLIGSRVSGNQIGSINLSMQDYNLLSGFEMKIYPNPSSGKFVIETEEEIEEIMVMNLLGQEIENIPLAPFKGGYALELSQQAKGIYFIKVKGKDGRYSVKRIAIQ